MYIVKCKNEGFPYYLQDQNGSGDPERTLLRGSAAKLKTVKDAEKLIENVVKEWGWLRKFTKQDFDILDA